jgi:hypothetical protein
MLGVDYTKLTTANPEFAGMGEEDFAHLLTEAMKEHLWPLTAAKNFGGKRFEVTYYLNPRTADDVRVIHPYAAIDLLTGAWVIRPPVIPENPRDLYPAVWFDAADRDTARARQISNSYGVLLTKLRGTTPGSAGWHNAGAGLNLVTSQARALFDDLHTGRRHAFGGQGAGYGDWNNFRWQRAKASGTVQAMHAITEIATEAKLDEERATYGSVISPAEVTLRRAALAHRATTLGVS